MNQTEIEIGADDESPMLLKLANGDRAEVYSYAGYYIDGSSRGYRDIREIAAGATAMKTLTWTALVNSNAPKAVADGANYVTERDETNNAEAATFSSTSLPDLVIEGITLSPTRPSIGDKVTFTITIKNQGSGEAGSSRIIYYIDSIYLTSATVDPIDAGATANTTFTWTAEAGSHAIKAVADSEEKVVESDETNNDNTYVFSVLAPDLIIQTITWSPENPSIRDKVTFTV
ncbi:MAG: CARDB domain-containing protein, partial [Chloroflexota bacterium]